jgi:hypothetical protein
MESARELEDIESGELDNENDLHYSVVRYLRRQFPDAIILPGLGELQRTSSIRSEAFRKGYLGGQPDLTILNRRGRILCIELKTPTGRGRLSPKQREFLARLRSCGAKVLVSNDLAEIKRSLADHLTRFPIRRAMKRILKTLTRFCTKRR